MTYEEYILENYSTPGLRKCELNRFAKKDHLGGLRVSADEAKKILDTLYGPENDTAMDQRPSD
jgi:hypothetical protein